jgi:hypothetical protein
MTVTLDIYSHVLPSMHAVAAFILGNHQSPEGRAPTRAGP